MDPIRDAIDLLHEAGILVARSPDPWLELYTAPGFPELTRNQVFDLAWQRRQSLPRKA
jgi:hypothetical protein